MAIMLSVGSNLQEIAWDFQRRLENFQILQCKRYCRTLLFSASASAPRRMAEASVASIACTAVA
jgi:hypothetical protein